MTSPDHDEAELEASRAPLLDHLMELRDRVVRAVIAITIGAAVGWYFADEIIAILRQPYFEAWPAVFPDAPPAPFITTSSLEFFFVQMRVGLFAGIALAFPYVAYELYGFIAPGLYRREKLAVAPYLVIAPLLFMLGMAAVYFFAMPQLQVFSLNMLKDQPGIEPAFRLTEYVNLFTMLMLAFGLAFQLPVGIVLAGQVGLVGAQSLRKFRKYAIVLMAAFAAIVTPADGITMVMMLVPTALLYEIAILIVAAMEKARLKAEAEAAQLAE